MKKSFLGRNILKLISVFFAISLWIYVFNSEALVVKKKISLDFVVPRGAAIGNMVRTEIDVTLKGSRAFLRNLFTDEERVVLDLSGYRYLPGKPFEVLINSSDIPLPLGVEIISFAPQKIMVELYRNISKYVPIVPVLSGNLSSDLRLHRQSIKPEKVMISGPVNVMRKVSKVETLPIDLSPLKEDGEVKVHLGEVDSRVKLKEPDSIKFFHEIRSRKANLMLKRVKIRYLSSRRRFTSKFWTVNLSVFAPEDKLKTLTRKDVQVIADVPEGIKGETKIKLRALLPDDIYLLKIHPTHITVNVK